MTGGHSRTQLQWKTIPVYAWTGTSMNAVVRGLERRPQQQLFVVLLGGQIVRHDAIFKISTSAGAAPDNALPERVETRSAVPMKRRHSWVRSIPV